MNEKVRSQTQASEMRFLQKIKEVAMFDKLRYTVFRESLNIKSKLLLRIEQSQLPKQALYAEESGKKTVGRPQTRWFDYVEDLGWNRLGFHPSEMQSVLVDREVWRLDLEVLSRKSQVKNG